MSHKTFIFSKPREEEKGREEEKEIEKEEEKEKKKRIRDGGKEERVKEVEKKERKRKEISNINPFWNHSSKVNGDIRYSSLYEEKKQVFDFLGLFELTEKLYKGIYLYIYIKCLIRV